MKIKVPKLSKEKKEKVLEVTRGADLIDQTDAFIKTNPHTVVGSFGLPSVDQTLGGIETGKIYSLVAPTGVGKTIMGVQVFAEALSHKRPVIFLSTEMRREALIARLLCRMTGIPEYRILNNSVGGAQRAKLDDARQKLRVRLDETQSAIIDDVRDADEVLYIILKAIDWFQAPLVILDHIHNLKSQDDIFKKISTIAHEIQEYVQSNNVAFFLLAQMSKEDYTNRKLESVSAKGAMDVNEVSDVFMILQRSSLKNPEEGTLTISKNRWGSGGQFNLSFKFPNKIIYERDAMGGGIPEDIF